MSTDDTGLRRWSQRKHEARAQERRGKRHGGAAPRIAAAETAEKVSQPAVAAEASPAPPSPADHGQPGAGQAEPVAVKDLPDVESLDQSSDFSAFLKAGVPEELQRRALRKLWRLDPTLANLDGLVDYGEDFTDKALVIEGLKTVYRVGKGLLEDDEIAPLSDATPATTAATEDATTGESAEDASAASDDEAAPPPADGESDAAPVDTAQDAEAPASAPTRQRGPTSA